ncbi:YbjN domain-containing protein [Micrococcales bacterium 31B]|nr:YbjN domain-containing protein [Micrococcales bacterium 31B]
MSDNELNPGRQDEPESYPAQPSTRTPFEGDSSSGTTAGGPSALSADHLSMMAFRLQQAANAANEASNSASHDTATTPAHTQPSRHVKVTHLPSVTRSRVEEWLNQHGYYYFIDNDGDIGTILRHRVFFIRLLGPSREILQIRGCWNHSLNVEYAARARTFCNSYNRDTVLQKTYVRVDDTGKVNFICDMSADLSLGVGEKQLQNFINSGLGSANDFFDAVDDQFHTVN